MKKLILILGLGILWNTDMNAQNRRGNYDNDMDDNYGNYPVNYNQGNYNQGNYNPYNDPNYYPNQYGNNGRCGTPPPPPPVYYPAPRPVVVVPRSYCAPVVISPAPYYSYGYRSYGRHHRPRGYGYRGRW